MILRGTRNNMISDPSWPNIMSDPSSRNEKVSLRVPWSVLIRPRSVLSDWPVLEPVPGGSERASGVCSSF